MKSRIFFDKTAYSDLLIINDMFNNVTELEYMDGNPEILDVNVLYILSDIKANKIEQLIFLSSINHLNTLIDNIRMKDKNIVIKIIVNESISDMYFPFGKASAFTQLLEKAKKGIVQNIAFFKKSDYEVFSRKNIPCFHILQNYIEARKPINNQINEKINIGIYCLRDSWSANQYNQYAIAAYIKNSQINYNSITSRNAEFLQKTELTGNRQFIGYDNNKMISVISKNDINVDLNFSSALTPIFLLSMENECLSLISNSHDFFKVVKNDYLFEKLVSSSEDNPEINSKKVVSALKNKEKIFKEYRIWKNKYNIIAAKSISSFLENQIGDNNEE